MAIFKIYLMVVTHRPNSINMYKIICMKLLLFEISIISRLRHIISSLVIQMPNKISNAQ